MSVILFTTKVIAESFWTWRLHSLQQIVTNMDGMHSGKYRVNQKVISYFSPMYNLWVLEMSNQLGFFLFPLSSPTSSFLSMMCIAFLNVWKHCSCDVATFGIANKASCCVKTGLFFMLLKGPCVHIMCFDICTHVKILSFSEP